MAIYLKYTLNLLQFLIIFFEIDTKSFCLQKVTLFPKKQKNSFLLQTAILIFAVLLKMTDENIL